MEATFEKESIRRDGVPIAILLSLSAVFATMVFFIESVPTIIGGVVLAILFALFPMLIFRYLRSFSAVRVSGNRIIVVGRERTFDFTVPADIRRLVVDADDLQIGFEKNAHRFLLRSCYLKEKDHFHRLFSQMLTDNPPPKEIVRLDASILEIMQRLKKV